MSDHLLTAAARSSLAGLTAYALADLAGVYTPDTPTSPGARFLEAVRDALVTAEADDHGGNLETALDAIADDAVPDFTHPRWAIWTDLGAYREDVVEVTGSDRVRAEAVADVLPGAVLYLIARRLGAALVAHAEAAEEVAA